MIVEKTRSTPKTLLRVPRHTFGELGERLIEAGQGGGWGGGGLGGSKYWVNDISPERVNFEVRA